MKETFAYAGAFYMLSKLYFSSLLATLNRREKIRTQMDAPTGGIISIPFGATTRNREHTRGKEISMAVFASVDEASTTMTVSSGVQTRGEVQTRGGAVGGDGDGDGDGEAQRLHALNLKNGQIEVKTEKHVV
uniref:Uncharacterized protein n=1 Tax=Psilocybe cubensis TaxID=181762 RepID=A0A8H8CHG0_PSICU